MATSQDKFRKLLGAYEDEVQRKQHKMGKKIDPSDEARPNVVTGHCTFQRGAGQVVWNPSFDVIGTFDPASGKWTWGWADQTFDLKIRSRMEGVRKQGADWGIDSLTTPFLTLASEQQAWELSIVATAVSRADAMYRFVDGGVTRFLALFDGPAPSRSSMAMRAASGSSRPGPTSPARSQTPFPSPAAVPQIPTQIPSMGAPALGRQPTPTGLAAAPALQRQGTAPPGAPAFANAPAGASGRPPSVAPPPSDPREPTTQTRAELGRRMLETLSTQQQAHLQLLNLLAQAQPPNGPVGPVALELRLTLRTTSGEPDQVLPVPPALHEALIALWLRCREHNGAGYRFATVRVENGAHGLLTNVFLEW